MSAADRTSWSTTTGVASQYDTADDLWCADSAAGCGATAPHELMIWLDRQQGPVPLGTATQQTTMLWTCGASGQDWRYPYSGQPIWTAFTNKAANLCPSGGAESATSITLHGCAGVSTPPQNWSYVNDGTLRYSCGARLDAGTAATVGSLVQLAPCAGSTVQQWLLSPSGYLLNPASSLCLDDPGSTGTPGVPLDLWTCNGTNAQVWYSAA